MIYITSYLAIILTILVFILASVEDLKKREVYDYINYLYLFLIIILGVIESILTDSYIPFKLVIFGTLFGFFIGSILFFLGIWGGGDSKLLTGIGGAIYFILKIFPIKVLEHAIKIISKLKILAVLTIEIFKKYVLYIDSFILIMLFVMILKEFLFNKKIKQIKKRLKDILIAIEILFLLFIGIVLDYQPIYLAFIGVLILGIIHFCSEEALYPLYFTSKKRVSKLSVGDVICSNIFYKNNSFRKSAEEKASKILINKDEINTIYGLELDKIDLIKEAIKNKRLDADTLVKVKHYLPFSSVIVLNLILYIIKILSLNNQNIKMMIFLFEYLGITIFIGGVFSIGLIVFYFIKYFKEIIKESLFSKRERNILFGIGLISVIALLVIKTAGLLLLMFIMIYLLIKVTRRVEKYVFIKKKNILQIVPGDWINEDIFFNGKKIYSVDEFKLGISEEQIQKIKRLSKKDNRLKKILVKDGIAFVPIMFIGFIVYSLILYIF